MVPREVLYGMLRGRQRLESVVGVVDDLCPPRPSFVAVVVVV
jgi:hypothetical protein